jgi:hypothetical protein
MSFKLYNSPIIDNNQNGTFRKVQSVVGFGAPPTGNQGISYGYGCGGSSPVTTTNIQRFTFATSPFISSTNVGNLTNQVQGGTAYSTVTGGIHVGGNPGSGGIAVINTFPFSTPTTASLASISLSSPRYYASGAQSSTDAFSAGGVSPSPTYTTEIFKIPKSTASPVTTHGNLATAVYSSAGQSSDTSGYSSGGATPTAIDTIHSYPFSTSSSTATLIGNLTTSAHSLVGASTPSHGFNAGGFSSINVTSYFPFATTPATSTANGNLLPSGYYNAATATSDSHVYIFGGYSAPTSYIGSISKYPYPFPSTISSEIGGLTANARGIAGTQT